MLVMQHYEGRTQRKLSTAIRKPSNWTAPSFRLSPIVLPRILLRASGNWRQRTVRKHLTICVTVVREEVQWERVDHHWVLYHVVDLHATLPLLPRRMREERRPCGKEATTQLLPTIYKLLLCWMQEMPS